MASSRLTARPVVPVLVRAAMLGSFVMSPLGCGDDDGTGDSGNSTDVAPTAGPCAHADGANLPECMSTGQNDDGDDGDGDSTATSGATSDSMTTSGPPTTTDMAPTAGPCVHADGSQLPECQEDSSGTATGDDTGSDTGSGSESGSSSSG
jgi:hypothetical protein